MTKDRISVQKVRASIGVIAENIMEILDGNECNTRELLHECKAGSKRQKQDMATLCTILNALFNKINC